MKAIFTDHSREYLSEFERASRAALEAVGNQAVSHAKNNVTAAGRKDTGKMRNDISYRVQGKDVYVGTNTKYAPFHEMGTGIYISGGRKSPWAYQDAEGNWHFTRGLPPIHFLKRAAQEHIAEYKAILKRIFKGG